MKIQMSQLPSEHVPSMAVMLFPSSSSDSWWESEEGWGGRVAWTRQIVLGVSEAATLAEE